LSFSLDLPAPLIQAKGYGEVAERIVKLAKGLDIPVEKHQLLTQGLIGFDPGQQVPQEYFQILSQIFLKLFNFEKGEIRSK
jgi:type III secretion system FlhB-like substrate exporter